MNAASPPSRRKPWIVLLLAATTLVAVSWPRFRKQGRLRQQAVTMENMRTLASAIERYHLANGSYPIAANGEELRAQVKLPDYARVTTEGSAVRPNPLTLDTRDGYGREMQITSQADGYLFVSHGSDDAEDAATPALLAAARAGFPQVQPPPRRKTACYEDDIVFTMGMAIQYPDGPQNFCRK
jgi:type II secretory pathway pseudopilin PulG